MLIFRRSLEEQRTGKQYGERVRIDACPFLGSDVLTRLVFRFRREYLLFPDDVTVEKVASDTTGRTYVFKFSSSDQRLFVRPLSFRSNPADRTRIPFLVDLPAQYWFQDADSSKYERFARNINVFLQNPDSFPGSVE
jgi:hypothetical protein